MMGFYPDCPGEPSYTLTKPRFSKVEIKLAPAYCTGNELLVIKSSGASDRISAMRIGASRLNRYRITHEELTKAGTLTFK